MSNENMIAGLLAERAGYVAQGRTDRVALVDEQLKHYGHQPTEEPAADSSPAEQRAAAQAEDEQPKRRGRPPKSTAEQTEARRDSA